MQDVLKQLVLTFQTGLTMSERGAALEALGHFDSVFNLLPETMCQTDWAQHMIEVGGSVPIHQCLRKVPIHQRVLV